ncbi:MAG: PAS domain S-box protein [Bacteroidales bacterium]
MQFFMQNGQPTYEALQQRIKELENQIAQLQAERGSNHSSPADNVTGERTIQDIQLLQVILEDILAGYWDWDIINNTEYLSPAFKKMFGYEDHELPNVPETWQKLIFPEDLPSVFETFNNHVQSKGKTPYYNEIRYRHKNGSTIWVICTGRVIEWLPDGQPKRMVGLHIDITRQKLDTEKIRLMAKMLDKAPGSITVHDFKGRFIYANNKTFEIHGYTEDEFMAKNLNEIDIPESAAKIEERMRIIAENDETSFEVQHRRKDGSVFPLEVYVIMVDWQGTPAILSIATDISQRKQSEQKLQEKDLIFNAFMEYSPVYVFFKDHNIRSIHLSRNYEKVLGRPLEQLIGKTMYELFPSDLAKRMIEDDKKIINEGKQIQVDETLNGRYYTSHKFPITFENKPPMLAGFTIDVTDHKLAEENLKQTDYFLQKSQSVAHIGSYYFNAKTGDWIGSLALNDIFGIDETFTKNINGWIDLIHPEFQQEMHNYLTQHVITGHNRFDREYKIIRFSDKQVRWVHGIGELEFDENGNTTKMIGTIQDITERKNAGEELLKAKEKAEESDRLKTAFLQNISHEIRTPMNAIVGFSELLLRNYNDKEKLEQFSEIINQRCNDLLDIINEILDIAKIESGQLSEHLVSCNLNTVFENLKEFFDNYRKKISKQHIDFLIDIEEILNNAEILTDATKLKQILINLINNAFKFTNEGIIKAGCRFTNENELIFFVQDTGIGIPAEKHDFIFERFTQVEYEMSRNYGGTGLGLPIVKGLVGLLGGRIWLESVPGKGSTFYFTLPYRVPEKTIPLAYQTYSAESLKNITGTVLVVEDDLYNSQYLKEVLRKTGLKLLFASYGKDAVEAAMKYKIDLILMDIRLPDIDGYMVTREIKKLRKEIKIIAQTAYAAPGDDKKAFEAGCDDYISKPINKNQLISKIKAQLLK